MRDTFFGTSGPRDAKIAIVGESWGEEEAHHGKPFIGTSGQEFDRMLLDAGIDRNSCFVTNTVSLHPPGNKLERLFLPYSRSAPSWRGLNPTDEIRSEINRMHEQLRLVNPVVTIAAGNYALWALTGEAGIGSVTISPGVTAKVPTGIMSWRGSMLESNDPTLSPHLSGQKVLPIIHPAAVNRAWYLRSPTVHDLRTRIPLALANDWRTQPNIIIPTDVDQCLFHLRHWLNRADFGPIRLSSDIETYRRSLITCIGFSHGHFDQTGLALVIPLVRVTSNGGLDSFWSPRDESRIMQTVRQIFAHGNIHIEGQNYLYDTQYFQAFFGLTPRCSHDTMLAQHLLFPGTPLGLDYLSSLYCKYHRYWKEDGKDWFAEGNERKQLLYNGEDCLRTGEVATTQRRLISDLNLVDLWENEKRKAGLALRMMNRGIRVDSARKTQCGFELLASLQGVHSRLERIMPHSFVRSFLQTGSKKKWYESEHQQRTLFYEHLGLEGKKHRKTKQPTINDEALNALQEQYPFLFTIFELLKAERSINTINSNVVQAEVDPDGRMRSFLQPAGPETFRWSSSENAFGRGTNMQNLTVGDEE